MPSVYQGLLGSSPELGLVLEAYWESALESGHAVENVTIYRIGREIQVQFDPELFCLAELKAFSFLCIL